MKITTLMRPPIVRHHSPLLLLLIAAIVSLNASAQPFVTGLEGASGSTIGPGGAMYVAEGAAGRVSRIDLSSGEITAFVTGLPMQVIPGLGGPIDIAFIGDTAYVLVSVVSIFGAGTDGIYRIDGPDSFSIIADLGAWSAANLPPTPVDLPTGVQYAIVAYRGELLVTDGHHNRVLHVTRNGAISTFSQFGNDVPTGLDVWGDEVYLALAGPTPHLPEDGQIVSIESRSGAVSDVASGARLAVDVERGRGSELYALAQGEWDGLGPGTPALPNTGALLELYGNGTFIVVEDGLDRPTSVEIVRNTAYVVTMAGEVLKLSGISNAPFGR